VNILIAYGTSEGQTRKISEHIKARLRERGCDVEVRVCSAHAPASGLEAFDAFIVAASVHQKQHQDAVVDFVTAHRELLSAKPSAFISVSLAAAIEAERAHAQEYAESFLSQTKWQPRATLLLEGALRFSDYDYFQEQIVKFVLLDQRPDVGTGRDHEFTDWNTLDGFIDAFAKSAG
jgi:menaquinone-dependent protoporphyrinogen oxidase